MNDLKEAINSLDPALRKFTPGFNNTEAISFFESVLNKIEQMRDIPEDAVMICSEIRDYVNLLYSKRKYKEYGGLGRVKMNIAHGIRRLTQQTRRLL